MTYVHETYRALKAGRELRGWSQAEMAEKMAEATGDDGWNEARITAIENKRRKVSPEEMRTLVEIQGFDVTFYWYGPPLHKQRVGAGDSQRYVYPDGVNGLDVAVITKTDSEAAEDSIRPRQSLALFGAKDLGPATVLSYESPKLDFEDDDWLDLLFQKTG